MASDYRKRYETAWNLYLDPDLSEEAKLTLQKEMDSAQNEFTWDEFQEFKKTLKGFVEHWDMLRAEALDAIERLIQRDG